MFNNGGLQHMANDKQAEVACFHPASSGGGMMFYTENEATMIGDSLCYCMIDSEGDNAAPANENVWRLGWYDINTGEMLAFHMGDNMTLAGAINEACHPQPLRADLLAFAGTFASLDEACHVLQKAIGDPDGDIAGMMFSGDTVIFDNIEHRLTGWENFQPILRSCILIDLLRAESQDARFTSACVRVLKAYSSQENRWARMAVASIEAIQAGSVTRSIAMRVIKPDWATIDPSDHEHINEQLDQIEQDVMAFAREKTMELLPGFKVMEA